MPVFILSRRQRVTEQRAVALDLLETLTGRVGGFLEVSQMLTGRVPIRGLVLDTYLTGLVPGVTLSVSGEVLDLVMTAGGMDVESFQYSAERGQGARLDVTVIGDARGARVPVVTAKAGKYAAAAFYVPGGLPEWEAERNAQGWTTTLHASDRVLVPQAKLPELVPWETQEAKDAKRAQEKALRVAKVPPAQREAALRDGRRMAVDNVVLAALATVPHRLLVAPPFPGYDFRADGDGPTYSTAGRTAQQVVQDLWGMLGITAGWEGGVLTIRPPGPTGDLVLPAPIESERYERITLDAPTIELQGGTPTDDPEDTEGDGTSEGDDPDAPPTPDDPDSPDKPDNSPDPDERDGDGTRGFAEGISPTPQVGELAPRAVPLSWEAVPNAIQYILERVEGQATPFTLWSRIAITTATRYTDDTARPLTTYTYRLTVNATAYAGDERHNVIWQPSEGVQVTTPPADVDAPPHPPTDLEGYWRSSTAVAVKWTPPKADPEDADPPRRGAADYYRIEARRLTADETLEGLKETAQTWAVLEGLPTGALLRLSVYAVNKKGDSKPARADVQLVNLPPGPAPAPELKADEKKPALTATWERVSGATEYEVEYAVVPVGTPEENIAWRTFPRVPAPPEPKEGRGGNPWVGLSGPGVGYATRYAFRVRGWNELGPGAWSPVAYEITASEPPQPEPDPELDGFEKARTSTISTRRTTEDTEEETTVWKIGGRVTHMNRRTWQKLAVVPLDWDGKTLPPRRWYLTSVTNARYFYEIPGWPLTLTGSVTETILNAVHPTPRGDRDLSGVLPEIGQEQEKIHQEWSPQGWLNRRTTWRSKPVFVEGEVDEKGEVVSRKMGNQEEMIVEIWYPVGDGLWYYQRTGTITTLAPVFVRKEGEKEGDWEGMETTVKALPGESSVSEDAPPMAVLPKEKDKKDGKQEPPPLTRNPTSPALNDYPLDRKWFSTLGAGNGDPAGPNDTPSTPGGSGNPKGVPEPDAPPKPKNTQPVRVVKPAIPPGGPTPSSSGNGAVLSATIPWVRTAAGLARYAAYMAQQGGPRIRITRTYILPTTPPSLDAVQSISVSGSAGQFSMTVVTETR